MMTVTVLRTCVTKQWKSRAESPRGCRPYGSSTVSNTIDQLEGVAGGTAAANLDSDGPSAALRSVLA